MSKERATATFKIGGDEIRYEASREAVEAQLEKVMDRLLERGATVERISVTGPDPTADEAPAASEDKPVLSDARLIEKLYHVNADGRLVMSRTPKSPADVLLLVLYGMGQVQDSPWVPAPTLMQTAREAGARFERGDRMLAKRPTLIQTQGQARGKHYRLTPKGEEHCRRLVRSLVAAEEGRTRRPHRP